MKTTHWLIIILLLLGSSSLLLKRKTDTILRQSSVISELNAEIAQNCQSPTVEELQTRLKITPDGILGPETKAAWDKAIYNRYASEHF